LIIGLIGNFNSNLSTFQSNLHLRAVNYIEDGDNAFWESSL